VASLSKRLAVTRKAGLDIAAKTGKKQLVQVLERATLDLRQRLTQVEGLKAAGRDIPFTEERLRLTLLQVQDVTRSVKRGIKQTVLDTGQMAADKASNTLLDYLAVAEKTYRGLAQVLPLDEAAVFFRATSGVESSVLHRLESDPYHPSQPGVLDRYGTATIGHFEELLQQGLITREHWVDVRNNVIAVSPFLQDAPAYWAERIVRTESMHAYGRASWEGMREADAQLGDMCKILCATFDDRTGWDSYQVHGQIRRVDEAFEWSDPKGGVQLYQHPPNRPNDREAVVPHRLGWDIPAELEPLNDGEVVTAWTRDGRTGAPPERPKMSTVDIKKKEKR